MEILPSVTLANELIKALTHAKSVIKLNFHLINLQCWCCSKSFRIVTMQMLPLSDDR